MGYGIMQLFCRRGAVVVWLRVGGCATTDAHNNNTHIAAVITSNSSSSRLLLLLPSCITR